MVQCSARLPRGRCKRWVAICPDAWFEWITGPRCAELVPCPRCVGLHPMPRVEVLPPDESASVAAG